MGPSRANTRSVRSTLPPPPPPTVADPTLNQHWSLGSWGSAISQWRVEYRQAVLTLSARGSTLDVWLNHSYCERNECLNIKIWKFWSQNKPILVCQILRFKVDPRAVRVKIFGGGPITWVGPYSNEAEWLTHLWWIHIKKNLWSPWLIQKYLSVVKDKEADYCDNLFAIIGTGNNRDKADGWDTTTE